MVFSESTALKYSLIQTSEISCSEGVGAVTVSVVADSSSKHSAVKLYICEICCATFPLSVKRRFLRKPGRGGTRGVSEWVSFFIVECLYPK